MVVAPTLDRAVAEWCFTVECAKPRRWTAAFSNPAGEQSSHDDDLAVRSVLKARDDRRVMRCDKVAGLWRLCEAHRDRIGPARSDTGKHPKVTFRFETETGTTWEAEPRSTATSTSATSSPPAAGPDLPIGRSAAVPLLGEYQAAAGRRLSGRASCGPNLAAKRVPSFLRRCGRCSGRAAPTTRRPRSTGWRRRSSRCSPDGSRPCHAGIAARHIRETRGRSCVFVSSRPDQSYVLPTRSHPAVVAAQSSSHCPLRSARLWEQSPRPGRRRTSCWGWWSGSTGRLSGPCSRFSLPCGCSRSWSRAGASCLGSRRSRRPQCSSSWFVTVAFGPTAAASRGFSTSTDWRRPHASKTGVAVVATILSQAEAAAANRGDGWASLSPRPCLLGCLPPAPDPHRVFRSSRGMGSAPGVWYP